MSIQEWNAALRPKRLLTNLEKQIVLGTLLGTGSIICPAKSKCPHIQLREAKSNEGKWLCCKAEYLKRFARSTPFSEDDDSYRWSSISDMCWKELYDLCYTRGHKKITMTWLDQLTDIGLTTWYIDKGYEKNKLAHLKTSRFGKQGTQLIAQFFNEVACECEVIKVHGLYNIRFTQEGSRAYYNIIDPCFPKYLKQQYSTPYHTPKSESQS